MKKKQRQVWGNDEVLSEEEVESIIFSNREERQNYFTTRSECWDGIRAEGYRLAMGRKDHSITMEESNGRTIAEVVS